MLTLYYARGTTSLGPHILLEEAGAAYVARAVDFDRKEQTSPAYLAINPRGRVPALETPHGVLTEAPAILTYIAQTHPDRRLAPDTPFALARAQEFNSYCAATAHVAHAHRVRGERWSDDAAAIESMRAKVAANMTDCARMIEAHFLQGPWVLGDDFSMCDAYLFVIIRWMKGDGVDMSQFDRLRAHEAAMRARDSVRAIIGLHE